MRTEKIAAVLNESKPIFTAIIFNIPFSRVYKYIQRVYKMQSTTKYMSYFILIVTQTSYPFLVIHAGSTSIVHNIKLRFSTHSIVVQCTPSGRVRLDAWDWMHEISVDWMHEISVFYIISVLINHTGWNKLYIEQLLINMALLYVNLRM